MNINIAYMNMWKNKSKFDVTRQNMSHRLIDIDILTILLNK